MDEAEFLVDPTDWLKRYICEHRERINPTDEQNSEWEMFNFGRLAVGLELETKIRIFRSAVGNSMLVMAREEICSALHQVIVDLQLGDGVGMWYDILLEYRDQTKLRFAAEPLDDVEQAEKADHADDYKPEDAHGPIPD